MIATNNISVLRMNALLCFMIVTLVIISNPFIGFSQSTILQDQTFFVNDKVGSDFNQYSITSDKYTVLFHKDRLEFLSEKGDNPYFFILLKNAEFEFPQGEGLVKKETADIQSTAMARMLKSDTMDKSFFKYLIYTDKKSGKEILVSFKDNAIEFNCIDDLALELQLWGNSEKAVKMEDVVVLKEFEGNIEISSKNSTINTTENNISFLQNGSEKPNLHFALTLD